MKLIKKELKDMIAITKRFFATKEKPTAKIVIQTGEDSIKVQCNSKQLIGYFELTKLEDEMFSITVNPFELEKIIKGRGPHFEAIFEKMHVVDPESKAQVSYENYDPTIRFAFEPMRPFNQGDNFVRILKETEDLFDASDYEGSQYMQIKPSIALAVGQKRIHKYSFNEQFYPEIAHVHGDAISVLSKSLKGEMEHSIYKGCLVIQNKNAYYILNSNKKVNYPNLRKMAREKQPLFTFKVDASLVNESLKGIKKMNLIEITFLNNLMRIDFRSEEQEPIDIPIKEVSGHVQKTIFEFDTLKQFFASYDTLVKVENQRYKNILGDLGFLWWSNEPEKMVMVAGVTEPDYKSEWEKQRSIG